MSLFRIAAVLAAFPLLMGLAGCDGSSPVAVVNPAVLIADSVSGKAGATHLKHLETVIHGQLEQAQKMIDKNPGNEQLRVMLQEEFSSYQELVTAEQQKVTAGLNQQIRVALEVVRQKRHLDAVLSTEQVLAFRDSLDVTRQVLEEMDKAPLSFTPVQVPPLDAALRARQQKDRSPEVRPQGS